MSSDSLVGKVLDGKYAITRQIAKGGMGTVYEAQNKLIDKRVAVKVLHSKLLVNNEVVTRFQREAKAAAAIGHENIIEIIDMGGSVDDWTYIVMELLEGQDLKRLLDVSGPLPPKRAANISAQALSALQAAHGVGIIHRDIKPENIFLTEKKGTTDYVKLLDFGICKVRSPSGEEGESITLRGIILGTPNYMAPEQARGDNEISPKLDIYSMGVILYQMVTGELPHAGASYQTLLANIINKEPPEPIRINPEVPFELNEIILLAMARKKEDRFENCYEFRKRLIGFIQGGYKPDKKVDSIEIDLSSVHDQDPNELNAQAAAGSKQADADQAGAEPTEERTGDIQNMDIRTIGYANNIRRDERSFHIQTEVTRDKAVRIKTTILDRGTVLDTFVKVNRRPTADIVVWTKNAAQSQHDAAVKKVEKGKYD